MRLQAQVRGAWEKSRHERLLSLTEALQNLESLSEDHQKKVLDDLRDQMEQTQPQELEDEQPDTILVLDPSATTAQDDLATPAQPTLGHFPESILPVEEPKAPKSDSVPSASISTSSAKTEEISVPQGLSDAEGSYVVSPSLTVDERPVAQDLPPSGDTIEENTPEQAGPLPKSIAPSLNDQTIAPDETIPTKDEPVPSPLESFVAPKVPAKPTTLRDASSSTQPSDLALSQDSAVSEPDRGGEQSTMGRDASPANEGAGLISQSVHSVEQAKPELDLPAGVNDNQHLSKVIRHLHKHYTRTSTTGADGLIHARPEEPDAVDLPAIPISKVQLKYTQEESKLWEQIVPTSGGANIDIARVVEQLKELASVELPQDEPEPEPAEQEAEQEVEQEGDEAAPISEQAATLEEQSGLMVASLMRRANPPTTLTYAESRLILEAMGVPCLESPMHYEAEALASSIVINGLADLVGSEDTDVLMYNAPLLRHMTNKKVPLQIIAPSTETGLGLSRSAFVDAAILMGTDFVRRLEKVGPATAYRLMDRHGSIERMLEEEPKFRPPDVADYLEQVGHSHAFASDKMA
ncbi:hypothetical protein FRC10_006536 [Ceratobasidium sp. 414]|nr:hypothetical protein FRC10_006536 [Ceratobasidium sp. 414]